MKIMCNIDRKFDNGIECANYLISISRLMPTEQDDFIRNQPNSI